MQDIYLVTSTKQLGYAFSGLFTDKRRAEALNDRLCRENPIEVIPIQFTEQLWLWTVAQKWLF